MREGTPRGRPGENKGETTWSLAAGAVGEGEGLAQLREAASREAVARLSFSQLMRGKRDCERLETVP